jgi:hypothetical protein
MPISVIARTGYHLTWYAVAVLLMAVSIDVDEAVCMCLGLISGLP